MTAKVYLVGAGPGDPDLLTVQALRAIQDADLGLYDDLVSEAILALVPPGARAANVGKRAGRPAVTQTANGRAPAWRITLDRVKVGSIGLSNVDAIVIEHGLNVALLGMSFLNRVEMRRDGETMVLTRLY